MLHYGLYVIVNQYMNSLPVYRCVGMQRNNQWKECLTIMCQGKSVLNVLAFVPYEEIGNFRVIDQYFDSLQDCYDDH